MSKVHRFWTAIGILNNVFQKSKYLSLLQRIYMKLTSTKIWKNWTGFFSIWLFSIWLSAVWTWPANFCYESILWSIFLLVLITWPTINFFVYFTILYTENFIFRVKMEMRSQHKFLKIFKKTFTSSNLLMSPTINL